VCAALSWNYFYTPGNKTEDFEATFGMRFLAPFALEEQQQILGRAKLQK